MAIRLFYDKKTTYMVSNLPSAAKESGMKYDDTFFNYYNDVCPGCQQKMKVVNNTVRQVGSVTAGIAFRTEYMYPYVLCKTCAKDTDKDRILSNVQGYVFQKVPHLGIILEQEE
ncbi:MULTISPECIES: hypothetical protein [Bacillus]|nr:MULTISPECIES: hypothetical protein [unclassified Bacillus cereus group]AFQ13304.1 hypothetical protein BCK_27478 [Bacillus cereus FRI-35]MDX5841082.1 hypothetical protein [Bacillus cereus group sp. BfR-BA-01700]MDX5846217.1 hypothetical protein [Bacillus cereus group sp. BfR-BA-01233]MDX5941869.1 hypothetical protein [Bacillus cereus group sp. BfR-BA-00415]